MISWSTTTRSHLGTLRLAEALGRSLAPGQVVALAGDLGAGKTTFVQGLARGLGVFDLSQVLSPTYALVNEYPGAPATLVHIDFYRLESAEAGRALGLDEVMARPDVVVAIEWADRLPQLVPPKAAWVHLSWQGPRARRIEVTGLTRP